MLRIVRAMKLCPECEILMRKTGENDWKCLHCDIEAHEEDGVIEYRKFHIIKKYNTPEEDKNYGQVLQFKRKADL